MTTRSLVAFGILWIASAARAEGPVLLSVDGAGSSVTYHLVHKMHKVDGTSHKVEGTIQEKMSGMTAGLGLPPGFKLPF